MCCFKKSLSLLLVVLMVHGQVSCGNQKQIHSFVKDSNGGGSEGGSDGGGGEGGADSGSDSGSDSDSHTVNAPASPSGPGYDQTCIDYSNNGNVCTDDNDDGGFEGGVIITPGSNNATGSPSTGAGSSSDSNNHYGNSDPSESNWIHEVPQKREELRKTRELLKQTRNELATIKREISELKKSLNEQNKINTNLVAEALRLDSLEKVLQQELEKASVQISQSEITVIDALAGAEESQKEAEKTLKASHDHADSYNKAVTNLVNKLGLPPPAAQKNDFKNAPATEMGSALLRAKNQADFVKSQAGDQSNDLIAPARALIRIADELAADGDLMRAKKRLDAARDLVDYAGYPKLRPQSHAGSEQNARMMAQESALDLYDAAIQADKSGEKSLGDTLIHHAETVMAVALGLARFNTITDLTLSAMEAFTGKTVTFNNNGTPTVTDISVMEQAISFVAFTASAAVIVSTNGLGAAAAPAFSQAIKTVGQKVLKTQFIKKLARQHKVPDCLASGQSYEHSRSFIDVMLGISVAYASGPCDIIVKEAGHLVKKTDDILDAAKDVANVRWGTWQDLSKVTVDGTEYAQIGDHLYTRHAIDRMAPTGWGTTIVGTAGRGVPTLVVEATLRNGEKVASLVMPSGVVRETFKLGTVQVITENSGKLIVTVMRVGG
jgi:hypothetical protein